MTKTIAKYVGCFMLVASALGVVWGASSKWHSYCATETIHETKQDDSIDLALRQSDLIMAQRRSEYLEAQITWLEQNKGCPGCSGQALRTYQRHLKEWELLQKKIQKAIHGN